jgi:hypothetical protein
MFRRVLSCALVVLVLAVGAQPAVAQSAAAPKSSARVATTYTVHYRKAGTIEWKESRTYPTIAEANGVARRLFDRGFEVQVHSRVTMAKVPARPKTATLPLSETVSEKQLAQIFRWAAGMRDIAFRFPADGCYARAHIMITRLERKGFKPYKVWSFQNGDPLFVRTSNHPSGHVEWRYHVAPLLRVRLANGTQRWFVIDPALFQSPVSITQWRNVQKKPGSQYTPFVTVTRLGQAPKDAKGTQLAGSGYWPGVDPKEGIDAHAAKMMRLYKPFEGRLLPKTVAAGKTQPRRDVVPQGRKTALASRRELALAA